MGLKSSMKDFPAQKMLPFIPVYDVNYWKVEPFFVIWAKHFQSWKLSKQILGKYSQIRGQFDLKIDHWHPAGTLQQPTARPLVTQGDMHRVMVPGHEIWSRLRTIGPWSTVSNLKAMSCLGSQWAVSVQSVSSQWAFSEHSKSTQKALIMHSEST